MAAYGSFSRDAAKPNAYAKHYAAGLCHTHTGLSISILHAHWLLFPLLIPIY